jgi:hypothetical protein
MRPVIDPHPFEREYSEGLSGIGRRGPMACGTQSRSRLPLLCFLFWSGLVCFRTLAQKFGVNLTTLSSKDRIESETC